MKFTYYDLGHLKRGSTVVVTLSGNRANVRLLDWSNYNAFKNGRDHRGVLGLATGSPVRLQVPHDGHWYVTVDLIGLGGSVRSGVRVEPPPLAPLSPMSSLPLSAIRHEPVSIAPDGSNEINDDFDAGRAWDVFISHATEDKDDVARPLADHLHALGVSVWLDVLEMRIGDSLRRKIDYGLAHSRFGVVILSRRFFAKQWPQYELDGLVTRQNSGEQSLLRSGTRSQKPRSLLPARPSPTRSPAAPLSSQSTRSPPKSQTSSAPPKARNECRGST